MKYDLALKYIDFVTSAGGQNIISNYGKDKYGEPLFFLPSAEERYK